MRFAVGFAACWASALALAWLWRRLGRGDAAEGAEAARKLQAIAVPAVGGLAVLVGWWLSFAVGPVGVEELFSLSEDVALGASAEDRVRALFAASCVALLVGWLDDTLRGGLSPPRKLLGQALAGSLLGLPFTESGAHWGGLLDLPVCPEAYGYAFLAVVACNLLNTFDNADGALPSVAGAGLFAAGLPHAGAVTGLAALQLLVRRGPRRDAVVYLGDAGSHLLGVAVAAVPRSWPLLLLPALDLARVVHERSAAGQPAWVGDRRHLAHRLRSRGLGSRAVALLLVLVAAPALVWPGLSGAAATTGLFWLAVRATREDSRPAACPGEAPSR